MDCLYILYAEIDFWNFLDSPTIFVSGKNGMVL